MSEFKVTVPKESSGMRLDLFVMRFSKDNNLGLSRNFVQRLIEDKKIIAAGVDTLKPHYKVRANDELKIIIEEKKPGIISKEAIPLDIVYEDEDLAVINKPAGLVVHPAPGNYEHTLVNALLFHFKNLSDVNPERPGIVHRLDKETSGLIVVAKNNPAHQSLVRQFAKHTIKRKYAAIVRGKVEFDEGTIEAPIGRHPLKRQSMSVGFGDKTRYAKTRYRTLKRTKDYSLLELEPFTGRTHQLRVHLAFLGHPILGDSKYGRVNGFGRLALHAFSLGFIHPRSEKYVEFSSEMPQVFRQFVDKISG